MRSFVFIAMMGLTAMGSKTKATEDLRALGEYLAGECVTCHQPSNEHNGIPSIIGWDTWAFELVMNEYRNKEREHEIMQTLAASLSDEEVKALAMYFNSLKAKDD